MPTRSKSRSGRSRRKPVDLVVVFVTVPDAALGGKIARALVGARLAACVNVVGPIRSVFRWQGRVDDASEHLLVIKTRRSRLAALESAVAKLHPYELPELLALTVAGGSSRYLRWVAAESSPAESSN